VNPKDDASLRRIINWPARGIGKSSIETLGSQAFTQGTSFFEVLGAATQWIPKTAGAVLGFRNLIVELQTKLQAIVPTPEVPMSQAMVTWAQQSLERIQSKKAILEESDDPVQAARKWDNVEELIHSIGQYKGETQTEATDDGSPHSIHTGVDFMRDFLNLMTLQAQDAEKDEEKKDKDAKNQVTLLTFHGAKGLEYPVVFMVGMEEGFLPHRRTLEELTDLGEERRLCYVGITRARDHLYLVRAKNRIRYGKPVPRTPSRFLEEIPKDLLLRNDQSTTPDFTSKEAEDAHEGRVKNYLAEIRANLLKK
jgi:superfamily I DNA/RNA helicase